MLSIIRFTLITALRDFLFIGLFVVIFLAMLISCFLGSTALSEQEQMTITYLAGITRLIISTGLVIFVCFHVKRAFDNKEIEVMLSKSISRVSFILSYWLAFALLSFIITIPIIILIKCITNTEIKGLLYWGVSLIFEDMMIIAFALVSSLILKSAVTSVLSTLCFYFLSRMMGFFVAAIHFPFNLRLPGLGDSFKWFSEWFLQIVSIVLPRLDLFAKTSWLVYGSKDVSSMKIVVVQSLIYIPLLLAMAIYDFRRKQF